MLKRLLFYIIMSFVLFYACVFTRDLIHYIAYHDTEETDPFLWRGSAYKMPEMQKNTKGQ